MTHEDAVLAVLRRLEADNRMMKRVGGALLTVLALVVCGSAITWQGKDKQDKQPAIQNILRTRRLEVANADGEVVAVLQAAEKKDEPGWLTEYHDNGRRKWRAQVVHNRYDGSYTAWWPTGLKSEEGTFDKGRKHGLFTTYHENGQPASQGACSEGKRTGIWISWHDNGEKASEGLYEDDLETGAWKEWHPNGELLLSCAYKAGKANGGVTRWHNNGQKYKEYACAGDVIVGPYRRWHSNGQIHQEGAYDEKGKRHGEWKAWNADGSVDLRNTGTWEHGNKWSK